MKIAGLALPVIIFTVFAQSAWLVETVDSNGDVGFFSALELDSSDNPCIAYCDQTTTSMVKYAEREGLSWNIQTVDSSGSYCSLVLDPSDNPHISYCDQSSGTLKCAQWNGSEWLIEVVDSSGCVGGYTSLVLNSAGEPRIAYMKYAEVDNPIIEICYAYRNGTFWEIEEVSSTEIYSGFNVSLALDSLDFPHIAYEDYGEILYESLFYASWDGSAWEIDTVSTTMSGYYNSLVIDTSNNPHLSFQDWGDFEVKHAFWTGSEWCIEAVSGSGKFTSLYLDNQDNPSVSYQSCVDWFLHYALWNGTSWDNEVVENISGEYTSHEVFSDGLPCVSYYADGELRFARRLYSETDRETYAVTPEAGFSGAFPNPSSTSVSVHFNLPLAASVQITVYDVSGRRVVSNQDYFPEGENAVIFQHLKPGIYFCRMIDGDFVDNLCFAVTD